MRSVMRMRHYCDFCSKAGGSAYHMRNHEQSCTLNPGRVCKMCIQAGSGPQAAMADLLALLPDPAKHQTSEGMLGGDTRLDDQSIKPLIEIAMPALRESADECPVCILAALRQKGIPVPIVDSFNFKAELAERWGAIDDLRREDRGY